MTYDLDFQSAASCGHNPHMCKKNQRQWSVGSRARGETDRRTRPIALPCLPTRSVIFQLNVTFSLTISLKRHLKFYFLIVIFTCRPRLWLYVVRCVLCYA